MDHCEEQCVLIADQDSVRLLAVETCGPLARLLNKNDSVHLVLPIVQKFAQVGTTGAIQVKSQTPVPVKHMHSKQQSTGSAVARLCCYFELMAAFYV